jgi:hypothetical protein
VSFICHSSLQAGHARARLLIPFADPSLTNNGTDSSCHVPERDESITMYTWGCLYYSGSSKTTCDAPDPKQYEMLSFYLRSPDPERLPRLNLKPKVPWNAHTHTETAYPWNFDERTFQPLNPKYDVTKLLTVKPANVHWLKIIDMPGSLDPKDRGYATMNYDL